MSKRNRNKSMVNISNQNTPKEMPSLLANTLENTQKEIEFQNSLPDESKEPALSAEIKKGLNDEQLAEWESFKQQYQDTLKSLKDLHLENQKRQKEFDDQFSQLDEKEQLLEVKKSNFEKQQGEQQQQLEQEKIKHEQYFADENQKLQYAQEKLSRQQADLETEQKNFSQELAKKRKENSQKIIELNKREQDLMLREIDAKNGFAQLNEQALFNLKAEVSKLQNQQLIERNKLSRIQAEIIEKKNQAEQTILQKEQEFLQDKENIANEKRNLEREKRRLNEEFRELKSQQTELRDEVEQEFSREINRLNQDIERLNKRLQDSYHENDELRDKLNEYVDFQEILSELKQSPNELKFHLQQKNQEIIDLKTQLNNSNDETLRGQLNFYQQENRGLKNQNEELQLDLSAQAKELSQLKLGVADKELLETEKRVLNKQRDVLQLRINELAKTVDDLMDSQLAETPFPEMKKLDDTKSKEIEWSEIESLEVFATELQHRIAQAEKGKKLYFRLDDIRLLLAGLSMSQLHIFQGISGTGKTSLAKAFAKAVNGFCTDISVQAGWRDRDDLLGHYNAFEKKFYEKDCLQGLYRANTDAFGEHIHIILLDEMNLSRPEQYFAEFLSALEKNDVNDRLITLSESALPNAPKYLKEGRKIQVPRNVWFIGTANHDETTNEFADKTYDRAFVMNLPRNEETFEIQSFKREYFGAKTLQKLFAQAKKQHFKTVKALLSNLKDHELTLILEENFGLGWGNRFEDQALRFIPVFIACGGSALMALDHLLASRVLRQGKVTGRYDVSKQDIEDLREALHTFSKGEFKQSIKLLDDDLKRKERGL
ncbi:AAA family ATPase [Conchiformibius steedae]|uniref:AAA family ATPase n=1 Tax=Conchiformibius steedae TaxID=153493 RepID=A0A3P2A4F4_9NEIS|nr:AAA family ATPase [Conchiformibius steedae]RRD90229.1 AAA family ATPase [Conchiformibius steedae]